jgi:putative flippase GtrA
MGQGVVRPGLLQRALVLVRSAGVGLGATLTDLFVLTLLASGLGLSPRLASLPALAIGIGVQFVGNKLFAFADRSRAWLRQGVQFLAVETLGFVANLVLFDLAVTHVKLPYLALRLLTTNLVYFGVCLPLWTRIFRIAEEQPS